MKSLFECFNVKWVSVAELDRSFSFSLGTDISGLLMIRIMILCVFILDYVVVIRLITRGGESAVDFQTEASPGSVRQSACVGSAVHSSPACGEKSTG